jgi:hypothetical protein
VDVVIAIKTTQVLPIQKVCSLPPIRMQSRRNHDTLGLSEVVLRLKIHTYCIYLNFFQKMTPDIFQDGLEAYRRIFWPNFIEHDGCVFLAFDEAIYQQWFHQTRGDKRKI